MKRFFTFSFVFACSFVFIQAAHGQTVLAKWIFDSIAVSSTAAIMPTVTTGTAIADSGVNAAGSAFTGLHASASTVWSTPSGNGSSKSLSSNNWAAGDYYQFKFNTTGYSGINLSWSQIGSNTGPKSFKIQYSTNGTTFTDVPGTVLNSTYDITNDSWNSTTPNATSVRSIDLSTLTALNNVPEVFIRIVVAAGSTAINGTAIATAGTGRVEDVVFSSLTVLPISLGSFNATLNNNLITLNWNTLSEEKVSNFSIERGIDGRNFETIGSVIAKNNSNGAVYSFTDDLGKGIIYYRLKMIDKDGTFSYSKVVSLNGKTLIKLELYPNPVVDRLIITHSKAEKGTSIEVFSMDGRKVITQIAEANSLQTFINVLELKKGNYILVLTNGSEKLTTKFTK